MYFCLTGLFCMRNPHFNYFVADTTGHVFIFL